MNDRPNDDRLIDDLRAALDDGAAQLPTSPPPFGEATATPSTIDGTGHKRLLAVAAAGLLVVGGAAALALAATRGDGSDSAATQPPIATLEATADGGADDTSDGHSPEVISQIATVLEAPDGVPELCTNVLDSYPPQCGGPPITNWDWSAVESEAANGTTWGEYILVGHYDETFSEFTLTEPARVPTHDDYEALREPPSFNTPCPTPEGGWREPPPSTWMIDGEYHYPGPSHDRPPLQSFPGYGGSWWDSSTGVLNVRIVGDQQAREDAGELLTARNDDPICIVESTRTWEELQRIQNEINEEYWAIDDAVITSTGLTSDPELGAPSGAVILGLRAPDDELIAELHDRYGDAIRIDPSFGALDIEPLPGGPIADDDPDNTLGPPASGRPPVQRPPTSWDGTSAYDGPIATTNPAVDDTAIVPHTGNG